MAVASTERTKSYGEDHRMSVADKLGNWLSMRRFRSVFPRLEGARIADVGCGYRAQFIRPFLEVLGEAYLIDVSVDEALANHANVRIVTGRLPDALEERADSLHLDGVLCNNVLEHLWEPERTVAQLRRHLMPGGVALINVPSWRGKVVLETLAFKLNAPSRAEIDDHKNYYSSSELWRLLVLGGFKPSEIRVGTHKFTLNTYAICTKG